MDDDIGPWEVLAFVCELAMLAALAIGGWNVVRHGLGGGPVPAGAAAVLLPLAVAAGWGRWLAPRSAHRLRGRGLLTAKVAVFGVASALLALPPGDGHPAWAAALFVVSVADLLLVERARRRRRAGGISADPAQP